MRVHEVSGDAVNSNELARGNIPGLAYYLLRPDGHIGLAGATFSAAAIERWFADSHIGQPQVSNIPELPTIAPLRHSGAGNSFRQAAR